MLNFGYRILKRAPLKQKLLLTLLKYAVTLIDLFTDTISPSGDFLCIDFEN